MNSETIPPDVLFAESQRLNEFADFWRRRIEIDKAYLENLSGLRIPDLPGNGQLQELAHKTREILLDELEERRRGLAKLNTAYRALTDEFWKFDQCGGDINQSLLQMDSLAAEVATAESIVERLAIEERKENFPVSPSAKKESKPRPNVISRLLHKARNSQPEVQYDTSSFLIADSAYRQKIQKLNDEKYIKKGQNVRCVEHNKKCIVALKHIFSAFSAVHSDLAQVLNVTSSQLCIASSSVDATMESASFAERLDESFTSLIPPYRYTSYDTSSLLRPTTMLFGCALPDKLDGASIGQRAVVKAFEMILSSAAHEHPISLYQAICDALQQPRNEIKPSALQLESLWDPSQGDAGPGVDNYMHKSPSASLLVYFLVCLPEPFLPLEDSFINGLAKPDNSRERPAMMRAFVQAVNGMGTARRCILARFFLTLKKYQQDVEEFVFSHPEGLQILIRTPHLVPKSPLAWNFSKIIRHIDIGTMFDGEDKWNLSFSDLENFYRDNLA